MYLVEGFLLFEGEQIIQPRVTQAFFGAFFQNPANSTLKPSP